MNHKLSDDNKISTLIKELISGKKIPGISNNIVGNDVIIVGLSGGADSVALTYFLYEISYKFNLKIIGCHINHGIRGSEADEDQQFVRTYCKKLKIELLEKKVNLLQLALNCKKSLEEIGRDIRYQFFDECSKKYNAKIATAHNMNDNAETIILNLIRGSGLKGMCGIPNVRQNIIRPFINFTRQDIEKYCHSRSLNFVVDSTNELTDYNRNLIRHKIIPVILKINPNFASTINRNCDIILEDEIYLSKLTDRALKTIYNGAEYLIDKFNQYPVNIRRRMIKSILEMNNLSYSYKKIKLILDFIDNQSVSKLMLSQNRYIYKQENYFIIKNLSIDNINQPLNIKLSDSACKVYIKYNIIKYKDIKEKIVKDKSILKKCIDYDKIVGEPVLRNKQSGDIIKLAYRKVSKSLKKLFNEAKIPIEERKKILVISDDLGVIWIDRFGADERVNVNKQTENILFIF